MPGLGPQVRKQKDCSRQVGGERFGAIKSGQDPVLPYQQVGIVAGELFPALVASGPRHALLNKKDVGPGYGLVVKLGLPAGLGKSSQGPGEYLEGFKDGVLSQIQEGSSNMLAMMETLVGESAVLKLFNQFLVSRRAGLRFLSSSFRRWLALESNSRP
jgi:hypothetical protein